MSDSKKPETGWLNPRRRHIISWVAICVVLMTAVLLVEINAEYFRASLLEVKVAPPFNGTVYPLKKVPDWVNTGSDERDLKYADFPASKLVSLPPYEPTKLTVAASTLEWGNPDDNAIRNAQVTFSVPYLGTYNLDGEEGKGSHPAVDIKTLKGTPVYAIANGVVKKVSMQSNGFGHHVVIEHQKVPTLIDDEAAETLLSSYSHLDEISVKENEVILKGAQIGTVGDTGTATTDHLHFQIDKESASFTPYWPFTYTEAQNAGYSFFDAVNEGLGKSNAKKYTINPMEYVKKYLAYAGTVPSDEPDDEVVVDDDSADDTSDDSSETDDENTVVDDEDTDGSTDADDETVVLTVSDFKFEHKEVYSEDRNIAVTVTALAENGEKVMRPEFDKVTLELSKSIGALDKKELQASDFENGRAKLRITPAKTGWFKIYLYLDGERFTSSRIDITEGAKELAAYGFEHDGDFLPGVAETIKIVALDEDGNRVQKYKQEGTVRPKLVEGEGTMYPESFQRNDFDEGAVTFKFTPTGEAPVKFSVSNRGIKGESEPLIYQLFSDVDSNHENYEAIKTLKLGGIIGGYPDGSFKPNRKVARVEALKMIFEAVELEAEAGVVDLPFSDVTNDQWYSSYVAIAYNTQIVNGYPDGTFRPATNVSRVEFLKMLINALEIDVDPMVIENPYEDVNKFEWYAPYVQWAKSKNLLPVEDDRLDPGGQISRAEVAEIVYRVLVLQRTEMG